MTNYIGRLRRRPAETSAERSAIAQLFSDLNLAFSYNGIGYSVPLTQDGNRPKVELPDGGYDVLVERILKRDAVVFGAVDARAKLLSETEFKFQNLATGELFGTPALSVLESPAPNMPTGELLYRGEQDTSIVGNWFVALNDEGHVVRLNPDWTSIQLSSESDPENADKAWDTVVEGYWYAPPGARPRMFLPSEVAHWSPIPDPACRFRGMSWMTPALREILGDQAITEHKLTYMGNAATPNMVVKFPESLVDPEQFKAIREAMSEAEGVNNAGKTLFLMAGADATVVGAHLKELDLKDVQSIYENRIAVASRVPAVVLGTMQGMSGSSLNSGNFNEAKKSFSQLWYHSTVKSLCAAVAPLVEVPAGARLWFDPHAVALLNEDLREIAETSASEASTMRTLVEAGFDPDTVTAFAISHDPRDLKHSGKLSVQLQAMDQAEQDAAKRADPTLNDVALTLQKIYLAVGTVITAEEARAILKQFGGPVASILGEALPGDLPNIPVLKQDKQTEQPQDNQDSQGDAPMENPDA